MQTLEFSIHINAPRDRVWESLWSNEGYAYWTAVFMEGSRAETDWKEGSGVRFVSPDGGGMYALIRSKRDGEAMIFEHRAEIKNGEIQPEAPWAGAQERYFLTDEDGGTLLRSTMDVNPEWAGYFNEKFPPALARVKELAERE